MAAGSPTSLLLRNSALTRTNIFPQGLGYAGLGLLWLICLMVHGILCGAPHLSVAVLDGDQSAVTSCSVGEEYTIDIVVHDVAGVAQSPELPGIDPDEIVGRSTTHQMTSMNGQTSSEYHFQFVVRFTKAGMRTLGPWNYQLVSGDMLTSPAHMINVAMPEAASVRKASSLQLKGVTAAWEIEDQDVVRGQAVKADLVVYSPEGPITVEGVVQAPLAEQGWRAVGSPRAEMREVQGIRMHCWRQPGIWVIPQDGINVLPGIKIAYHRAHAMTQWLFTFNFFATQMVTAPACSCTARMLSAEERGIGVARNLRIRWDLSDLELAAGTAKNMVRYVTGSFEPEQLLLPEVIAHPDGLVKVYPAR